MDTGIFDDDRYFGVLSNTAKVAPEDIWIRITIINRGPDTASLDLLPTLWFRNEWASVPVPAKPYLHEVGALGDGRAIHASHWDLGERWLYVSERVPLLFTDNGPNNQRLFQGHNISDYVKDGINDYIVRGNKNAVRCSGEGSKA